MKRDKKAQQNEGDDHGGEGDYGNEPPRALVAVHPQDAAVAVGAGQELRVYDNKAKKLVVLLDGASNGEDGASAAIVRSIAFSSCGNFFACACEDKTARLWSTESWECIKSVKSPKKISVVAFNRDNSVMLAANKFGDVLVTSTAAPAEGEAPSFELLLGHYCSVITSATVSNDGTLLCTTDRDGKVRISIMPKNPLQGAHEIQSYGFGHTDFVSCSAFIQQDGQSEILLSGGGDGTLRMWNPLDGREISMLKIGGKQDENDTSEESLSCPVLAVCPSNNGQFVVAVLDGQSPLVVVKIDVPGGKLEEVGRCAVPGIPFASDISRDAGGKMVLASGPFPDSPTGALVVPVELDVADFALKVSSSAALSEEARKELQKCNEEAASKVAPQKMLPRYLHKKQVEAKTEDKRMRKAAKREGGESAGASAEEQNDDN